jgi:hypothetical protein
LGRADVYKTETKKHIKVRAFAEAGDYSVRLTPPQVGAAACFTQLAEIIAA